MRTLLDVYRTQFKVTVAIQLQYRVALVIWLIGLVLSPVIYLVIWSTVARANGGQAGGYTVSAFAGYFLVLLMVEHVTFTWVIYAFDDRMRRGTFSSMLLRPVHPIHVDVTENISYKLITLVVIVPALIVLTLIFHPAIHPAPWAVAAFVPALVMAYLLRFLLEWTVAMVGFWTSRMSAIDQMYYVVVLFLSGMVAPLSLFPAVVQAAASFLPFRWMVAFPVELLVGRLSPQDTLIGFCAQLGWLTAAFVCFRLVWRAGLTRYSAVGT